MGQKQTTFGTVSSSSLKSSRDSLNRTQQNDKAAVRSAVVELPDQVEYLGACWLLASNKESLSPSRWFPLCPRTLQGQRGDRQHCFVVSPHLISSKARRKDRYMMENNITVHEGLHVCGYTGITISSFRHRDLRNEHTIQLGGVHIDVESTCHSPMGERPILVVIAVRCAEVHMEPNKYVANKYERVPVRAPPVSFEERQTFGEGCITGIQYGGYLVMEATHDVSSLLTNLCRTMARRNGWENITIVGERGASRDGAVPEWTSLTAPGAAALTQEDLGVVQMTTPSEASPYAETLHGLRRSDEPFSLQYALGTMAAWALDVCQRPETWTPTCLFLERYEAIGETILHD